jgi:hypothetical protein
MLLFLCKKFLKAGCCYLSFKEIVSEHNDVSMRMVYSYVLYNNVLVFEALLTGCEQCFYADPYKEQK